MLRFIRLRLRSLLFAAGVESKTNRAEVRQGEGGLGHGGISLRFHRSILQGAYLG